MELLKQLYRISSKSGMEDRIKSFVLDCLADVPLTIQTDEIGNVFITKGIAERYPCVAAHLDEIHAPCGRDVVVEGGGEVHFGKPQLLLHPLFDILSDVLRSTLHCDSPAGVTHLLTIQTDYETLIFIDFRQFALLEYSRSTAPCG